MGQFLKKGISLIFVKMKVVVMIDIGYFQRRHNEKN